MRALQPLFMSRLTTAMMVMASTRWSTAPPSGMRQCAIQDLGFGLHLDGWCFVVRRSPLSCHPWGTLNIPRGSEVLGARGSRCALIRGTLHDDDHFVGANLDLSCFRECVCVCRPLQPDFGARCTMRVSLPFVRNHKCSAQEGANLDQLCRQRACVSALATRHQSSVARLEHFVLTWSQEWFR